VHNGDMIRVLRRLVAAPDGRGPAGTDGVLRFSPVPACALAVRYAGAGVHCRVARGRSRFERSSGSPASGSGRAGSPAC